METRCYRTIVRGRFGSLSPEQETVLRAEADQHDALKAAFTEDGTFTYDRALAFFAFRYQFEVSGDSADACDAEAPVVGELKALDDLERRNVPVRDGSLVVSVTRLSDMRTERRKAPKRPAASARRPTTV